VVITQGRLLGGRVLYGQPASGFRSGIEPVLLAAAIPASPDEWVLEAGTGAGAGLLCLCARVAGARAVGIEIDESMAALAAANANANGFANIEFVAGAIETAIPSRLFDHAMANPPYHAAGGSISPVAGRETAKRGSDALMGAWIGAISRSLRHRGSLTLIVPSGMVPSCLSAMAENRCPCTALFPLWPRSGSPAKLVLLRGVKNARMPMRVMSGLVLHQPDGSFTEAAQAILSGNGAVTIDD
jgi:tRNA1Val (adenine37-N6)-methyltransferase